MKVTVKDNYLNVRFGKPSVNAPCYQYIAPGSVIEVDGQIYKGDKYGDSSIDTWLKDAAENYYWSGGVHSPKINIGELAAPCDYNFLLKNVNSNVKANAGEDILIAILDTGCIEDHEALSGSIIHKYNAIDKSNNITDNVGHGTFVAGIIAGRSENLKGIAFRSKLIIVKIANTFNGVSEVFVNEGLRWLLEECPSKPSIINISLQFSPGTLKNQLTAKFKQLIENNTLMFAAGQDDNNLMNPSLLYPASDENVIGVGGLSFNSSIASNNQFSKINPKVKYVIPNLAFFSSNNLVVFPYGNDTGSSFATAVITGTAALMKANDGNVIENIDKSSTPINNTSFENNLTIFKTR